MSLSDNLSWCDSERISHLTVCCLDPLETLIIELLLLMDNRVRAHADRVAVHQAAAEVVVGDPLAPGTQMGPVVSLAQLGKVQAVIKHAKVQGATVFAPELRLQKGLAGGYYVP